MEQSKCCNSKIDIGLYSDGEPYNRCIECGEPCEVIEQSESTASNSKLSAEGYLNANGFGSGDVLEVEWCRKFMEEYASQKDAQIQALIKEVDELKKERNWFLINYPELKLAGNNMAEALNKFIGQNNMSFDSCELLAKKSLELWDKLNK